MCAKSALSSSILRGRPSEGFLGPRGRGGLVLTIGGDAEAEIAGDALFFAFLAGGGTSSVGVVAVGVAAADVVAFEVGVLVLAGGA